MLEDFYKGFSAELDDAEKALDGVKIKVPDVLSDEYCDVCGRQMVVKKGKFGYFLACPGFPECTFTKPIVVEMPGKCPKCGGRILKRTSKKGYVFYACERGTDCGFITWDVPTKDFCPACGKTMFKRSGRGYAKPFCENEECVNFVPEDQRGYKKKTKTAETAENGEAATQEKAEKKPAAKKAAAKKPAAKKTGTKTAAKKTAAAPKKTAAKKKKRKRLRKNNGESNRPRRRLAGSECAWQLAKRAIPVRLVEMKPQKMTPAHSSPYFAELVCSNSLRSDELTNAVGLLKAEMRKMGSLIMESADVNRVAAGGALAVDRVGFSRYISEKLEANKNIEIVRAEAADIPAGEVVIATGPLSSDAIAER